MMRWLLIFWTVGWLMNCSAARVALNSSEGRASSVAESERAPFLEVNETSHDLGDLGAQSIVSHEFEVHNKGTAPLEIIRVDSG